MGDANQTQQNPGGVFDQKPDKEPVAVKKIDFPGPAESHASTVKKRIDPAKRGKQNESDAATESAMNALNADQSKNTKLEKEFEDLEKISDQDLALAEKMIFEGFASIDIEMKNIPGRKLTIYSTSAEEMLLIDDIMFDIMKKAENKDGSVDIPQNKVQAMKNALFLAFSYRGFDGEDIAGPDSLAHLDTIKKTTLKLVEHEFNGDMDKAESLKASLKKYLLKRAAIMRRLPTVTIDFLSDEKLNFDAKMLHIMSSKKILPKS